MLVSYIIINFLSIEIVTISAIGFISCVVVVTIGTFRPFAFVLS